MPGWKDLAVTLCILLIVVGAVALAVAAQTFTIIRAKVLEKGVAMIGIGDGRSYSTQTLSELTENDDTVFRRERGTAVKYAVSGGDTRIVDVGSDVELLVSSYRNVARVIGLEGSLEFAKFGFDELQSFARASFLCKLLCIFWGINVRHQSF